jgi:chemotaxis protein methyltransferase CheR
VSELTDADFKGFQQLIHSVAGITLADSKRALVSGRLNKRLGASGAASFSEYLRLITSGRTPQELQTAVDLLTTNETYFFREPKHFEYLKAEVRALRELARPLRVWSAASSSGEEAYSIAMLLEDLRPSRWEVMGSDISQRVLEKARAGQFSMDRLSHLPAGYLQRFCLQGTGTSAGLMQVQANLRARVNFRQINLNRELPKMPPFDVIFLRNVLIYFNAETRGQVLSRVLGCLCPGGLLMIGHSDSLVGLDLGLQQLAPSIFRKPQ